MEAPMQTSGSQHPNHQNSSMTTEQLMGRRHNRTDSIPSQPTDASSPDLDDEFGGLQLLRDFDDEDMDDLEGH
jgi:hypothetical protein